MANIAKPLKIEAFGLQNVVAAGLQEGLTLQQIADRCTEKSPDPISHMAVKRYIEAAGNTSNVIVKEKPKCEPTVSTKMPKDKVEHAVRVSDKRVQRLVDRDIDLIELQYQTTRALADRFEWIAALPDNFERRMLQLHDLLQQEGTDTATLDHWGLAFTLELRRNIGNMAVLNREIRQNGQFMASLREKAFEFNLIQEYLENVLEEIRQVVGVDAFEMASERLITNPRLQRIVDEIHRIGGGDVG